MAVHETLRLHSTTEKFFLEPLDAIDQELVVIDRVSQDISLEANRGQIPPNAVTKTIYGVYGIIRLLEGPYLIVITKRSKVGEVAGDTIWKILDTELISYKKTTLHLNEQQIQDNKTYLSMIDLQLKTDGHYYSTSYDITHTLQRLHNTSPEFVQMPLHERADQRFIWNAHMLRELAQQPELARYCLPVLHGFVAIKSCIINGQAMDYILITRRCCFRAGTRYYMRGLDAEGYAANFVETEQIISVEGNRCSFVQTRGSIPMLWSQRPNLKYKPTPVISNTQSHIEAFNNHFDSQIYNYGKQVLVNLVNHTGSENLLEKAFAQIVTNAQNKNIRYESFDFHHECSKMRWDRLSILVDRLAEDQKRFGFFMMKKDGHVVCQQEGLFRSNCMDCLDRTNVVQSLLARVSLQSQLERLGVLQAGQKVENETHFEFAFKNIWADNADAVSVQYAGTGALKTDFTRLGKRTKFGLLQDGWNSALRYFKNNFSDGFRQDSIDLFLGNYIVEESEGITKQSPFKVDKDWKFYALPTIFVVAFAMLLICILIPDEHLSEQFMYMLFWGTGSFVSLAAIYMYGTEFVNRPKLSQVKVKED
ncbi:phosphatidylinositol-3-phosphatase SAC1-like [Lineus longissimus]|uniref:phosphatidylinositol-3-phosphatase SAC1-like n=1 Tax=Lineus longissimus TaxID=88925 RepID=UPI002B4DFAB3